MTLVTQDNADGYREGVGLDLNYIMLTGARDEARAERVELVSGRGEDEMWKETNATQLPAAFRTLHSHWTGFAESCGCGAADLHLAAAPLSLVCVHDLLRQW